MINNLLKSKRKFTIPLIYWGAVVMIFVAYKLSFKQAISAVILNRQLTSDQQRQSYSEGALGQLTRKNAFYLSVVKEYQTKIDNRDSRLWSAISGIALSENVGINFTPDLIQQPLDTTSSVKGKNYQEFVLKGNYNNLVRFLDTLVRTEGIGKISDLMITSKKNGAEAVENRLTMKVGLVTLDP